jgi:inosine-uridine nucleoside N-ribohydrolase
LRLLLCAAWDVLTVAVYLNPALASTEVLRVAVDVDAASASFGRTVVCDDDGGGGGETAGGHAVTSVAACDAHAFNQYLLSTLRGAAAPDS